MSERLSELMLERYALGELEAIDRAAVEARLEGEPELAARLAALRASNDEVLAALPASEVAAEVARRMRIERAVERARARPTRGRWIGAGAVAVAGLAAVALFVVIPRGDTSSGVVPPGAGVVDDGDRAKGDPRLLLHVKRDGRVVEVADGARARTGDLIQLSYVSAGAAHGVVVSIDGGGAVSLHYPEQVGGATELRDGGKVALPHSYELDDAPAFERFFFVTSPDAIDVADLLERAASLAHQGDAARERPLPVPEHADQISILLVKERSR